MDYQKRVLENIKKFVPIFTVIGIFSTLVISFRVFPNDELPPLLKHNLLLTYLYVLLGFSVFTLSACVLLPLDLPAKLKSIFKLLYRTNEIITEVHVPFLLSNLILLTIGIVMTYSASLPYSDLNFQDPHFFLRNQFSQISLGVIIILLLMKVSQEFFRKVVSQFILIGFLAALTGLSFINKTIIGAPGLSNFVTYSSIYFEIAKIFLVFFLAHSFNEKGVNLVLIAPLIILMMPILFLDKVESMPTILLILTMTTILSIGRFSIRFAANLLLIMEIICVLVLSIPMVIQSSQLGGLLGVGLGESVLKSNLSYQAFTDSIFIVIVEELGLIGAFSVIIIFLVYTYSGTKIISRLNDNYSRLLILGCLCAIAVQFILSIGANINMLPTQGINLPFLSYGILRFELLINLFISGIVLNESKQFLIQLPAHQMSHA